jgi:hypothetical protein
MKSPTYAALVQVAATVTHGQASPELEAAFSNIEDWQALSAQAETHGLSVMLSKLASGNNLGLPREVQLQFKALTLRHQKVLAARVKVLADVINIFEHNNIRFALLKGAALSPLIYDPPWLRPMRDIDILVKKTDAQRAQSLLRRIGFSNEDFNAGYLYEHHHLPNSTREQDGFTISLEVHHDALSGDVADSINWNTLIDKPRPFELAGKQAFALGHTDMLKHLCHHTFEPAEIIKLGSIVDLIRYANAYVDKINWRELEQSQPMVCNTLRCVHALIPLPAKLIAKLGIMPDNWQPDGNGSGFKPLSHILRLNSKREKLGALFTPSEWWMHVFYAVPPGKSLHYTRFVRHPLTIGKWLFRRYRAAQKSRNI